MTKNLLIEVIEKLQKLCLKQKIKIAFTGGIAIGVYGNPRATYDVDGFILAAREQIAPLLSALSKVGFKPSENPILKTIQDKQFITLIYSKYKMYVDLFVATGDFQTGILQRAKSLKANKLKINIVSPEDLILLKLQAGREKDLDDVRGILTETFSRLDLKYLKKWGRQLEVNHFFADELKSLGLIKESAAKKK
jgi:predicted nucleotidyltransferase